MRNLIIALLFTTFSFGQEITIVHFNYKWNDQNAYRKLDRLSNVKVQYAFVEDQADIIKRSIKSVPVIQIYRNGKPVIRYEAGLRMRIEKSVQDIQADIDSLIVK
jgi:hypothetical protein